jgi:fructokinase
LNETGSATYTLVILLGIKLNQFSKRSFSKKADAFVYGSLVCRDVISHQLAKLIKQSKYKVFDVNLRPPFILKI